MTQPNPAPDAAAKDLIAAQETEYGTWVAKSDIHVGTALAYRAGDPVPTSNVKAHGYDRAGVVEKAEKGSK